MTFTVMVLHLSSQVFLFGFIKTYRTSADVQQRATHVHVSAFQQVRVKFKVVCEEMKTVAVPWTYVTFGQGDMFLT